MRIALIAHDSQKKKLAAWAKRHKAFLARQRLCATGTTGKVLAKTLGLPIERYQSGPLGGDQQIGAQIAEGKVDVLIFFWDPLEAQPHDVDVKALLRISVLRNVPLACNPAGADLIVRGLIRS